MVASQLLGIKIEDSVGLLSSSFCCGLEHFLDWITRVWFCFFCFLLTGTCSSNLYQLTPEAIPSSVGEAGELAFKEAVVSERQNLRAVTKGHPLTLAGN